MDCSSIPQHLQHIPEESDITTLQIEGAVMAEGPSESLVIAVLDNVVLAAPLSSEKPTDECKIKYMYTLEKQGKHILLYSINTYDSNNVPHGLQFITAEGIDKDERKGVEKILRSIFLEKNNNKDTAFRYLHQYNTNAKESVIAISSCEFNHRMENIVVLKTEGGHFIPRLIPKSSLVPGGVKVPEDQRRPVTDVGRKILAGIPNANLVPLPVVPGDIDKTHREVVPNEEGSEPPKDASPLPSSAEAAALRVRVPVEDSNEDASPLPSSAEAAALQVPAEDSNEPQQSVCTRPVPYRHSPEMMGVNLTMVFRHMRTSCDRSNVLCWMCLDLKAMFMHVLGCKSDHCPPKQLIAQGFAHHVLEGRCQLSPCSIPSCKEMGILVRDEDRRHPSPWLTTYLLKMILEFFREYLSQ
ncbi:uncharacterized protein LOC144860535 isoform X2 [Branchiostoma floridae x Branchiostoma japonicum]